MNAIVELSRIAGASGRGRMNELARLPVFFALEGKRVLIAGGTAGAAWKAELLSACGAHVDVYAAQHCEELLAIAADVPRGPILIHSRAWQPSDFAGAAVAVGSFEAEQDAKRFADAARAAGVPVNVVDKPDFCDFAFGAIVNRSPLIIGISTDGAAPVFAQAIRGKIEALIPAGFSRWAEAARRWRRTVKNSGLSFAARRRFWQLFTARAVSFPDETPQQKHFDSLLTESVRAGDAVERGRITWVDVGNGDADLLTLRAARALQAADVVLFDDGVAPEILDFARREAKKLRVAQIGAGREEGGAPALVSFGLSGQRVVRLGSGINGPGRESTLAACRAAGIAVEVVPGVAAV